MKEDFVNWLQEGILDKIISVKTAQKIYTAMYNDFEGTDFKKFIFSL